MREGPAVAVDLGWRLLPEGLRVAYWEDERGDHGQLLLEPAVLWQFSKLNDLRSIQDQHLRAALDALAPGRKPARAPAGMDLSHVSEWRKPWRLLRLYRAWKDCRVEGDEAAFAALIAWKERHDHLHEWEANLRDQVIRHRKEIYRRFVAGLLRTHGRVFLEDLQIRSMARKDRPEEETRNYSGSHAGGGRGLPARPHDSRSTAIACGYPRGTPRRSAPGADTRKSGTRRKT